MNLSMIRSWFEAEWQIEEKLRGAVFYAFVFPFFTITLPISIILGQILKLEKSKHGLFIMAYDPLFQRLLLHENNCRKDESTKKLMAGGIPGVKFLEDVPNVNYFLTYYIYVIPYIWWSRITGYEPGFLTGVADPAYLSSVYVNRITYIDELCEKLASTGAVEQVINVGAGLDLRMSDLGKRYPKVTCIEVNSAEMVKAKQQMCKARGIEIDHVTMLELSINEVIDAKALLNRVDTKKKTLLILEGVSYFMNREVVDTFTFMLAHTFNKHSSMVIDFWHDKPSCYSDIVKPWKWTPLKCLFKMTLRLIGEPIQCSIEETGCAKATVEAYIKKASHVPRMDPNLCCLEVVPTYLGSCTYITKY